MRYINDAGTVSAELDDSTQYATVYDADGQRPLATLQRRRVIGEDRQPRWTLFDTNGKELRRWHLPRSYKGLVEDSGRTLAELL